MTHCATLFKYIVRTSKPLGNLLNLTIIILTNGRVFLFTQNRNTTIAFDMQLENNLIHKEINKQVPGMAVSIKIIND